MGKHNFSMDAFVDELEILITKSAENSKLVEENTELRKRVDILEADQRTLINTKATEFIREVETEVMVRLAVKLAPIFGMTMPENYESMVRKFLQRQDSATSH